MEEMKEIEMTAEEVTENTDISEPAEENEGLVESDSGFSGGDIAVIGLMLAGAIWGAEALWKYALKPGYNWTKEKIGKWKEQKSEKQAEAEKEADSKKPEDK